MSRPERRWPRWWDFDDWIGLAVLAPASSALARVARLRDRPLRLVLALLILVGCFVAGLLLVG